MALPREVATIFADRFYAQCLWKEKLELLTTQEELMLLLIDPNEPRSAECSGDFDLGHLVNFLLANGTVRDACTDGVTALLFDESTGQDCVIKEQYQTNLLNLSVSARRCTTRLLVVPFFLGIKFIGAVTYSGHSNVLIIDRQQRSVEHFEPHGGFQYNLSW